MEWITALNEALAYMDAHLADKPDIASVAAHVHISPFYLSRGFQMVTGFTMGEYMRSRRLYEAALALRNTGEKVIDIALRSGYETPESFAKAFSRFHGCTPSQMRETHCPMRLFLPLRLKIEITGGNSMDYTVSPMWGIKLIGFERVFSYENAYHDIPLFWDEICEKYCNHTIYAGLPASCPQEQAIIDNCIGEYGACIDDLGNGSFRYLIAGHYTGGEVPEGMKVVEFPMGQWAKFHCTGPIPNALQALNTRIFKEWLPGNPDYEIAGGYNLEWYSCEKEKDSADYESAIWVPVKPRKKASE